MRLQPVALSLALLIVGTACSGAVSSPSGQTNPNPSATAAPPSTATAASSLGATPTTFVGGIVDPPGPPPLDLETAIVTTADVYFDTFGSGALPLDRATEGDILRLRDAIPPIHAPAYEDARDADWLVDDDIVIGYVDATRTPWAYPIRILNFHEIVNDELGGIPVLIFYCPLCRSGVVFDRRVEGTTLTFGNTSALYENDLVMYDHQTGSYWWQVPGRAIVGALSGAELPALPSATTTWGAWRSLHSGTLVLSRDLGFARDHTRDPFSSYESIIDSGVTPFPISDASRDPRLAASEVVLGIAVGDMHRVYPVESLGDAVLNDEVDGKRIVIMATTAGPAGFAYLSDLDDRPATFTLTDGRFVDDLTGTTWSLDGVGVSGPMTGARLIAVPSRTTFWFAYIGAFPDAMVVSLPEAAG